MNFVSAWQFAYSAYRNSVFLGHKWDFSLNGVAPLTINNCAGTWKDAGRWGGIWQNTCSKLTKTSVQLLFTTVSNSCKNLRFLRVFCVVGEQHDRCLGSWKTFARSVKSGSARPGKSCSRPLNPSPARGKVRKPVGADPSRSRPIRKTPLPSGCLTLSRL